MADIKKWSTGRLGNISPSHLATDHVNTKGLDKYGEAGLEAYIDEDIVRAYDDNRPLLNLLSNIETVNYPVDELSKNLLVSGKLQNSNSDWRLDVNNFNYFTDPENFYNRISATSISVKKGSAISKDGLISNKNKWLIGLQRDDGTVYYLNETQWNSDNKTPTYDDTDDEYDGYYRPIYSDITEGKLPLDFGEYEFKIRQITTTGNIFSFPIYLENDFIIPFSSSEYLIPNETIYFTTDQSKYPGYDYYPEIYSQLRSNNLGILQIGGEAQIMKNIRREEHKIRAYKFNAEGGAYKAKLESDAFRNQKSSNIKRIEGGSNFINIMGGVTNGVKYGDSNATGQVLFASSENPLQVLKHKVNNRDFLGNHFYTFSTQFSSQLAGAIKNISITSIETRAYQELGLTKASPTTTITITTGTYNFRIALNNLVTGSPTYTDVAVSCTNGMTLNQLKDAINTEMTTAGVYATARVILNAVGGTYDIRIYSNCSGDYSKILLAAGLTSDLFAALSTTPETAVDGVQEWPIYQDPLTVGDYKCIRSGGVTTQSDFSTGTIGRQLFDQLVATGYDNFTVGINTNIDSNHRNQLYIKTNASTQGYRELGMTGVAPSGSSGLAALHTYYFKLTIDGTQVEYSFSTTNDTTYEGVVSAINNVLGIKSKIEIIGGDLRFTSDAYGPSSTMSTANGTSGDSLFGSGSIPTAASHEAAVAGTGETITLRARQINTFTVFQDVSAKRVVYSLSDSNLYIVQNTNTDTRDNIETELAYISNYLTDRWSTYNDTTKIIDMTSATSWTGGAYVTKVFSILGKDSKRYLIVGNSVGQIYFISSDNRIYNFSADMTGASFTKFTDASLGVGSEAVNNFFTFDDSVNNKRYLFILTGTYIYRTSMSGTSGFTAGQAWNPINTSSSGSVPNVSDKMFSQIYDAEYWEAYVSNPTIINKYIIFVGKSPTVSTTWINAPILYALFDSTAQTFTWYADVIYRKTQIDNVKSIVKFNGFNDPEQTYQLYITNNANGPEIWAGNSQNSNTDIGGGYDDRFSGFSWVESNSIKGRNWLSIDNNISQLNFVDVFDSKMFIGGTRSLETLYHGFYSYNFNKLQKYFKRDSYETLIDGDDLYVVISNGSLANSDPCILKINKEVDEGRVTIPSARNLTTVSNWPSDSAFRILITGFDDVSGVNFNGEYNVVFDGSISSNLQDIVDAINGDDVNGTGFKEAIYVDNPSLTRDLTPIVRARMVISIENSGGTYTNKYKLIIESKIGTDPGSGFATNDVTASNAAFTINNPTTGTSVIGTGTNTMEIDPNTIANANLPMIEWSGAKCYLFKRVSTGSKVFNASSYIDLSTDLLASYNIYSGSVRVKSNNLDEKGFSQGKGKIITGSTATGLLNDSTSYTFKITFNGGTIRNVSFAGSTAQTMTNLISQINTDISGVGTASLKQIGTTGIYCDIVIKSSTTGDSSSVLIEQDSSGVYLFGINGIDTILNKSIQGSTSLGTPGEQSFGYTWENADYFVAPDFKVYIPNGSTRLDPGDTVWVDLWQYRELTKVSGTPATGQWGYDLNSKKIILGDQPQTLPVEDFVLVDVKLQKSLYKLDFVTAPADQEELSDNYYGTQPRNTSNSDYILSRTQARATALHYGLTLFSDDEDDLLSTSYSFFLPRVDIMYSMQNSDPFGNRVQMIKGTPDPDLPYTEFRINNRWDRIPLYGIYVNSQDYRENKIYEIPWYYSKDYDKSVIYLDENTHYFTSDNELISSKGLTPLYDFSKIKKYRFNSDYDLAKIEDPIGIYNHRKRVSNYLLERLDFSKCIFVSDINGNDSNSGETQIESVKTLAQALSLSTEERNYIVLLKNVNYDIETFLSITINKSFPIYLIAEYVANIPTITVSSSLYLEGINVTSELQLASNHNFSCKYCQIDNITVTENIINLQVLVESTVLVSDGLSLSGYNVTNNCDVEFNYVYLKNTTRALQFNPTTYNDAAENNFIFNHITNGLGQTGNVVETTSSTGITIEINDSLLCGDTLTKFDSDAAISINRSITYTITNSGTGSVVSNDSKQVTVGEVDIITSSGAQQSIARGYDEDSYGLEYIDRYIDVGAFKESRIVNTIRSEENSKNKDYIYINNNRFAYKLNSYPEKISLWFRFKPKDAYNISGVLFDSRSENDFNVDSGLFNTNGNDFIQIVYDNKSYGKTYLTSDKYCFKLIISNSGQTNAIVIGNFFTNADNSEYQLFHEIGVVINYQKIYNPKYNSINFSNDVDRKQLVIYTFFDRDLDRVFIPKNQPYEDQKGNNIALSRWHEGRILSEHFNIGGGWSATWFLSSGSYTWSTWANSNYNMYLDSFMISNKAMPLNIIKDFNCKEKIDLYENDYNTPRSDNKDTTLLVHCDNAHPYSETGVEPFLGYYNTFRPYEGYERHAIAVERASVNLLANGKFEPGTWFDRSNSATNWIGGTAASVRGILPGLSESTVAIFNYRGSNTFLSFVNPYTGSYTEQTIITGATPSYPGFCREGNNFITTYRKSTDTYGYFSVTNESTTAEYQFRAAGTLDTSVCAGFNSGEVAIVYKTGSLGYIETRNTTTGAQVIAPVSIGENTNGTTGVTKILDANGNNCYFIAYADSANSVKVVGFSSNLASTPITVDTIQTGGSPTVQNIKCITLPNNNILISWKLYTASADCPIYYCIYSPSGEVIVSATQVFSDGSDTSFTNYTTLLRDGNILFTYRKRSDDKVYFKIYDQNGTPDITSLPLRESSMVVTTVWVDYVNSTTYTDLILTSATTSDTICLVLETKIPNGWFRDVTGSYEKIRHEVYNTYTFFGNALAVELNHAGTAGQVDIWTYGTIASSTDTHCISGIFFMLSGSMELYVDGTAMGSKPITITMTEYGNYVHNSVVTDTVDYIKVKPLNYNGLYRFEVRFTPEATGQINVHVRTTNSSTDSVIDHFVADNVKLERNDFATSIDATSNGWLQYPISMKRRGNIFIRFSPEFLYATSLDKYILSSVTYNESLTPYSPLSIYYDNSDNKFKLKVEDIAENTITVSSDEYGDASVTYRKTDLNERHTLVASWDIDLGIYRLYIDNLMYEVESTSITSFKNSEAIFIGNYFTNYSTNAADCLFELIRVGDEVATETEIKNWMRKNDPFSYRTTNNMGYVTVKAINFWGVHASDKATIYAETSGYVSNLVLEVGNDYDDKIIFRQNGNNLAFFGSGGLTVYGPIRTPLLVVDAVSTVASYDEKITLRYGFTGTPPDTNDAYIEVERGSSVNSEIRWDESINSWTFFDGSNRYIAIDGRHIGAWENNNDWWAVANGTGAIRFGTGSSTSGGAFTDGTERMVITPTELVINDPSNNYDFRVESDGNDGNIRQATHAIFVDASLDRIFIGRNGTSGTTTGTDTAGDASIIGNLDVNYKITVESRVDTYFGIIEFRNNSGNRAGYIGWGSGTVSGTWTIETDEAKTLVINEHGADKDLRIESDGKDNMFFLDASLNQIFIGRASGVGTNALGDLVVNNYITAQWVDDTNFGIIEFRNNSGNRAGYIGDGNGSTIWELVSAITDFNITGINTFWNLSGTGASSFRIDTTGGIDLDVDNGFTLNENSGAYFAMTTAGQINLYSASGQNLNIYTQGAGNVTIDSASGSTTINADAGITLSENSGSAITMNTNGQITFQSIDNPINVYSDTDINFGIDSDNDGTNYFNYKNGANELIYRIDETSAKASYLRSSGLYHFQDLGSINDSSASATGTLKITLPVSWTDAMMQIRIIGKEYNTRRNWELVITGYNYLTGTQWAYCHSYLNGDAVTFTNVRLGHDGTYCCILLGTTSSTWNYLKVDVADVWVGHTGAVIGLGAPWTLSLITDETGITVSATTTPLVQTNSSIGYINYNPAQSGGTTTTINTIGELDILTSSTAADSLRINSSGGIDIDATNGITINEDSGAYLTISAAGVVNLYSASGQALNVYTQGAGNLTIDSGGILQLNADAGINLDENSGAYFRISTAGVFSIYSIGGFTVTEETGTTDSYFTLTDTGKFQVSSQDTSADSIKLITLGGVDIDANAGVTINENSGAYLTIDTNGVISLYSAAAQNMTIDAGGLLQLNADAGLNLDENSGAYLHISTSGAIDLFSASNQAITIDAVGSTSGILNLNSDAGFNLNDDSGAYLTISSAGIVTLKSATNQSVTVDAQGTGNILIGLSGSAGNTIIEGGTGSVTVEADAGITIHENSGGQISINTSGYITATAVSGQKIELQAYGNTASFLWVKGGISSASSAIAKFDTSGAPVAGNDFTHYIWLSENNVDRWQIGYFDSTYDATAIANCFYIGASGATAKLVLDDGNNYVGVGTQTVVLRSTLQVGLDGAAAGTRQTITIGNNGYAAPAAWNTDSNGDKIVFYNNGSNNDTRIGFGGTANFWFKAMGSDFANALEFYSTTAVTGSAPLTMLLTKGGYLGIGADSTPDDMLTVSRVTTGQDLAIRIAHYSSTYAGGGRLRFMHSRHDTIGSLGATSASDQLGMIEYYGVNTVPSWSIAAYMEVAQVGAAGATYIGADFVFYTATNAAAATEKLRIYGTATNYAVSVSGSMNVTSGNTYKINNVDINTGGTLTNVAYLNTSNVFTATQTISMASPLFIIKDSDTAGAAAVGEISFRDSANAVSARVRQDSSGVFRISNDTANSNMDISVNGTGSLYLSATGASSNIYLNGTVVNVGYASTTNVNLGLAATNTTTAYGQFTLTSSDSTHTLRLGADVNIYRAAANWATFAAGDSLQLPDTSYLYIGTGTGIGTGWDLSIYSNGTHGFIQTSTAAAANLYVKLGADDAMSMVKDGAVTICYDSIIKLSTTGAGARVDTILDCYDATNGTIRLDPTAGATTINYILSGNAAMSAAKDLYIGGYNTTTGISTNVRINAVNFYLYNGSITSDFVLGNATPSGTTVLGWNGYFYATKVYNAVWNDLAEGFTFDKTERSKHFAGYVYIMTEKGIVKCNKRAHKATVGVYSDTYGFCLGSDKMIDENTPDGDKLPIGISGKVKVWAREKLEIGDLVVGDKNGMATKANIIDRVFRQDRIIGKVMESSKTKDEKRIWILIK